MRTFLKSETQQWYNSTGDITCNWYLSTPSKYINCTNALAPFFLVSPCVSFSLCVWPFFAVSSILRRKIPSVVRSNRLVVACIVFNSSSISYAKGKNVHRPIHFTHRTNIQNQTLSRFFKFTLKRQGWNERLQYCRIQLFRKIHKAIACRNSSFLVSLKMTDPFLSMNQQRNCAAKVVPCQFFRFAFKLFVLDRDFFVSLWAKEKKSK